MEKEIIMSNLIKPLFIDFKGNRENQLRHKEKSIQIAFFSWSEIPRVAIIDTIDDSIIKIVPLSTINYNDYDICSFQYDIKSKLAPLDGVPFVLPNPKLDSKIQSAIEAYQEWLENELKIEIEI